MTTKYLSRDAIDHFSAKLGFEFRDGRAQATAKMHNLSKFYTDRQEAEDKGMHEEVNVRAIDEDRQRPLQLSRSNNKSAMECRGEARPWQCISETHWQSVVKSARSYRSPCCIGVDWQVVARHVTHELPHMTVMQDIHPRRDGKTEKEVCRGFGRAADTLTDVILVPREVAERENLQRQLEDEEDM